MRGAVPLRRLSVVGVFVLKCLHTLVEVSVFSVILNSETVVGHMTYQFSSKETRLMLAAGEGGECRNFEFEAKYCGQSYARESGVAFRLGCRFAFQESRGRAHWTRAFGESVACRLIFTPRFATLTHHRSL